MLGGRFSFKYILMNLNKFDVDAYPSAVPLLQKLISFIPDLWNANNFQLFQ